MRRFYKNNSVIPYIRTVKRNKRSIRENVFSYPPDRDANWEPKTYETCDAELDAIELPL